MAYVIAGGCGGMFTMGRTVSFGSPTSNVAHNRLLATLVNTIESRFAEYNTSFTPKLLTRYGDPAFPGTLSL